LDSRRSTGDHFFSRNRRRRVDVFIATEKFMVAVIGNMIAGLGVVCLFAATLRLNKSVK
jgi:hypothetical protein